MAKKKDEPQLDHMKAAEEMRSTMIVEKKKKVDVRQAFHKHFIKIKSKLNLKPEMEGVLWKHLKATKNDAPEKFDAGIQNFGIKK
jgi:hypothetical protein